MTHAEAARILAEAWRHVHGRAPTSRELSFAQAIAWLENRYGRAGQFARFAAEGAYNWGSLHARGRPPNCPADSRPGVDLTSVCFRVFPSDVAAAAAFVRSLTTRHWPVISAMRGTAVDVARAMRVRPAYYEGTARTEEGKVRTYARAIEGGIRATGKSIPARAVTSPVGTLLVLAGLGGAVYAASRLVGRSPTRFARGLRANG